MTTTNNKLPQMDELASTLKVDLQTHYEIIVKLLSKKMDKAGYHRASSVTNKWDRQIFSVFCSLVRIRNKDYFDWWWSVINSVAFHSKPMNSIPSFFGITISKGSLKTKLGKFIKASNIMMKGRRTLLDAGCFGVCAIDNRNSRDELMAHKDIDDHVKGQQPGYSNLGTNPENKDVFAESSIYVTLYKKASQFANIHYYRNKTGMRKRNQQEDEVT